MQDDSQILLVTNDDVLAAEVSAALDSTDLRMQRTDDPVVAIKSMREENTRLVLLDIMLGEQTVLDICGELRRLDSSSRIAILTLVTDVDDGLAATLLNSCGDDVVFRAIKPWKFRARVTSQIRRLETTHDLALKVSDSNTLIEITSRLVGTGELSDNLFAITGLLSAELDVARCSVVLVRPEVDYGLVIASSDDPLVRDLPIDLKRYPEIQRVVKERQPLVVSDVADSKLHEAVLPSLRAVEVASVALFPIARNEDVIGVIFLRFAKIRSSFQDRELVFCQTVANATAIALRNNEILESLKAKTQEVVQVQNQAESQLRALAPYEGFFRGSVDGMIVLSDTGVVLFANPKGVAMLGMPESSIRGYLFSEMVAPNERRQLEALTLDPDQQSRAVDFTFSGEESETIIAISAGGLGEDGMTLLTMRDVTEERITARRLIDAQARIIEHEKKSAMMEVAGGAAHELNQPLTSVMASTTMLRRLMTNIKDSPLRLVETIEKESERMASIIRRLSKLTEYTTKTYVGKARIIDLDAVSDDGESDTENDQ